MSDQGCGGVLPEEEYTGKYQTPAVPETLADSYNPADVQLIDQAYEKDHD